VADADPFLKVTDVGVTACGHEVGSTERALTATILGNTVTSAVPASRMVKINVTPDCSKVTLTSPELPTKLLAQPGSQVTTPFAGFSYEERAVWGPSTCMMAPVELSGEAAQHAMIVDGKIVFNSPAGQILAKKWELILTGGFSVCSHNSPCPSNSISKTIDFYTNTIPEDAVEGELEET